VPRKPGDDTEPTFEEALGRLEEIVESLERGSPTLEESLALFEEGTRLRALCTAKLETATQRIRTLADQAESSKSDAGEDE
jgi:exodeoxyribonuclease VII small subunit